MAVKKDLYEVLGVDRGASTDEIKKAYRKLAREHHPVVNPGNPQAEERFKEISFAKEVLLSDEKRKLYDEFGLDGLASGFDASEARAYQDWARRAQQSPGFEAFGAGSSGDAGIEDLLSQLFGHRGEAEMGGGFGQAHHFRSGGGARGFRGADLESNLDVEFVDAILGREIQMRIEGREPLRVKIPRGARDGTRIRLKGQGQPAASGAEAGDLYVRLRVRPHPCFRLEDDDLHLDVPVTIPELILGAEISIPTPDGMTLVKIPPRSANGQTLRLAGKGAYRAGQSDARGHLLLHLEAVVPNGAEPELEELAKKLEGFYAAGDPRARLRWEGKR